PSFPTTSPRTSPHSSREDHAGWLSSPFPVVNCFCVRPSRSLSHNVRTPPRDDENTRYRPSGAHDGSSLLPAPVMVRAPEPSGLATSIWKLFPPRGAHPRRPPLGDHAGAVLYEPVVDTRRGSVAPRLRM